MKNTIRRMTLYLSLLLGTIISYLYVDRALARFIHQHHFDQYTIFDYLTRIVAPIEIICLFSIVYLVLKPIVIQHIRDQQLTLSASEHSWLILSTAVIVLIDLKNFFKWVFARTWPATWVCDNPSLIQDNVYGFHFFKSGIAYTSFPSGHAAVIVAFMLLCRTHCTRYTRFSYFNLIGWTTIVIIPTSLILMNYHFVSDVLMGALLGVLCADVIKFRFY